ncbi:hypothetical protein PMIN05_011654 [Paraphaeosphaeria minitans]
MFPLRLAMMKFDQHVPMLALACSGGEGFSSQRVASFRGIPSTLWIHVHLRWTTESVLLFSLSSNASLGMNDRAGTITLSPVLDHWNLFISLFFTSFFEPQNVNNRFPGLFPSVLGVSLFLTLILGSAFDGDGGPAQTASRHAHIAE